MPNKKTLEDYRKEVYSLRKENIRLIEQLTIMREDINANDSNFKFLKKHAEEAGSDSAVWKTKYLLLEEQYTRLESEIEQLKLEKKQWKKN